MWRPGLPTRSGNLPLHISVKPPPEAVPVAVAVVGDIGNLPASRPARRVEGHGGPTVEFWDAFSSRPAASYRRMAVAVSIPTARATCRQCGPPWSPIGGLKRKTPGRPRQVHGEFGGLPNRAGPRRCRCHRRSATSRNAHLPSGSPPRAERQRSSPVFPKQTNGAEKLAAVLLPKIRVVPLTA